MALEGKTMGKRGYPLTVDANVDDLAAANFDGLVIPGGYAADIMWTGISSPRARRPTCRTS